LIPPYAHRQAGANWYEYRYLKDGKPRDSYWMHPETRSPIDQGEPSTALYALHVLVGHHGVFSLTPIWLIAAVGVGLCCADRSRGLASLGWLVAVTSIVCLTFYILRPLDDRNYGGMTSGFRWAFWFAPLWLACMLPAADALAERRWARWLACGLLCLSAMSAAYPTWNPWVQPWLTDLLLHLDWVRLGAR
jgi:hypothetical protein